MWYQNSFRRHLCDMHIEEWNPSFLSEFSPEDYYACLKKARVQTAMLYFQSHVGYCYYPTQSGHMHAAFADREDTMRRLAQLCRAGGIQVVGYYSLIYNNWAYYHHPEWRMVDENGRTAVEKGGRYGLCCPNNLEYRAFVAEQIREISDYFEFDAMFFDMPFWPHACYCPACQTRWEKEAGGALPHHGDLRNAEVARHIRKRQEWMAEFTNEVARLTKEVKPETPVEFNLACMIASHTDSGSWCTQLINESCDYAGGDLYGGLMEQSVACKYYRNLSNHQPFEYMTSRCNPNLTRHTITKSEDQLMATTMLTCAHHGATLMIDAIDPVGTLHSSVYEKIGRVFAKEMEYEPYLQGELAADAAVFFNTMRKTNLDGQAFDSYTGAIHTSKTLMEQHIPFTVLTNGYLEGLESCKLLFLPYANTLDKPDRKKVLDYVAGGGTLYFSGAEEPELLLTLLGGKKRGHTAETVTYIAPQKEYQALFADYSDKYPIPFDCPLPIVEGIEPSCILATVTLPYTTQKERRFASIHSNPPGIATGYPALACAPYGKGRVVWSAAPLENETIRDYKQILMRLIRFAVPQWECSLNTNAPQQVELILFHHGQREWLLHAVQINEADEIPQLPGFSVRLKADRRPEGVFLLPDRRPLPFSYKNGFLEFTAEDLTVFDMYQILFS